MTDNEIVKALECCCKNNNCEGCPLDYLTFSSQCASELAIKSLDLINRQNAEIERLKSANDEKFRQWDMLAEKTKQHYADLYEEAKDILKAEAYKEFADKLKEKSEIVHLFSVCNGHHYMVDIDDIDNLLKEMVGEDK